MGCWLPRGVWILGGFKCLTPLTVPSCWSSPSQPWGSGWEPIPELDPVFPRVMEFVLCPQTWCCIRASQAWKGEVPAAAPKAQHSQGQGIPLESGEQSPASLSCWSCSPSGTFWNSLLNTILSASLLCFTVKTLIVRPFIVVRGDSTPLWADSLIFSAEPVQNWELKGDSPAEGLGKSVLDPHTPN